MANQQNSNKEYKNFDKLPLPVIVTDINGKVFYKNLIANEYLNLRKGCSLYKYAADADIELVKFLASENMPSVLTLGGAGFACCCLVVPNKADDETELILTAIPYAPEFFGKTFAITENKEFFSHFEKKTDLLLKALEGKLECFSGQEINKLKNKAVKLKRLERRLVERLSVLNEYAVPDAVLLRRSGVELCSFVSKMCESFNKLSGIVGFRLIYIPRKSHCAISVNSAGFAKLFIYLASYCVKYLDASGMNVYVDDRDMYTRVIFESTAIKEECEEIDDFDFSYISYCAREIGAKTVRGTGEKGNATVELHFSRNVNTAEALSCQDIIFDVTEKFIQEIIFEAKEFFA